MKKELSKLIAKAPQGPGVYKFLDKQKKIIYVGKAKSLRKRLQSYVRPSAKLGVKTEKMLEAAEGVEWTETNSEVEALILEDNLVKNLQPKYNILLKDDKNFQYIKVTVQKDYPEVLSVRRIEKDGAKYFGPKTNGTDAQRLLESVKRIFKLCSVRNITLDLKGTPLPGAKVAVRVGGVAAKRPCLDYHIKRCVGPCAGLVTPQEYHEQIDRAVEFLSGKYEVAIGSLKKQMVEFAAEKKFERAAAIRDQIHAIERSAERQLITDTHLPDRDVIAYAEDLGKNYFVIFQIRGGKLIGQEKFISEGGEAPAEVMEAFLREYYGMAADIPKEIIISVDVEEKKLIEEYIAAQTDHKVILIHPQAGQKDRLVELALKNARSFALQSRTSWESQEKKAENALAELQKYLNLRDPPKRIECYDISHLGGTETVGSMVVFIKGEAKPADYRQFRLRSTLNKNDDYKSLEEVMTRRLNYLPDELPEGFKIRKAKKNDLKIIEETIKDEPVNNEELDYKQFHVLEKNKKIVGFGRIRVLADAVHDITSLWVNPKERGKKLGRHLIKKLIENSKQKRLYLNCHATLRDYYLQFGFEEIAAPPKQILDKIARAGKRGRDISNIIYLAYQKKKKDFSFESKPDLIVIDGGKGQLSAAHDVLFSKGLNIPIISLAKQNEEVFVPGKSDPINLPKNSEAGYLLQRIRDEAHRFAIEFNRSSRDKKMVKSGLDVIPGIGPKAKKKLLAHFGSVHRIKEASQVELEQVVGEALAMRIKESL